MLINGEQSFVCNTQENMEGIADHTSSFNGDVGLPYRMCPVQADEGCLAFGYAKDQSRLIRHCDHFTHLFLHGRHDHVIIAGATGLLLLPACPLSVDNAPADNHRGRRPLLSAALRLYVWIFKSSEIHDYIPGLLITFVPADLPVLFKESLGHCAIAGVHSTFVQ